MYVFKSPLSDKILPTEHTEHIHKYLAGAESPHKKDGTMWGTRQGNWRERHWPQRASLPDQYTNTNADTVIDEPLLTTEGRKLSTIIGWNVNHSWQWCVPVSCHTSSGSTWHNSFTCVTHSRLLCLLFLKLLSELIIHLRNWIADNGSNVEFVLAVKSRAIML